MATPEAAPQLVRTTHDAAHLGLKLRHLDARFGLSIIACDYRIREASGVADGSMLCHVDPHKCRCSSSMQTPEFD
jgi:hypothetical protein